MFQRLFLWKGVLRLNEEYVTFIEINSWERLLSGLYLCLLYNIILNYCILNCNYDEHEYNLCSR